MKMAELDLIDLRQKALKAAEVLEKMNEAFVTYPKENLMIILSAIYQDGYNNGFADGVNEGLMRVSKT